MPTIDNTRRLLADDFSEEERELITKIGELYNYTIENITNVVNGQLDYANLAKASVSVNLTIGANGIPTVGAEFNAPPNMIGCQVLRAVNTSNAGRFPTNAPFVTFTRQQSGTYRIQHVTGLHEGDSYTLLLELTPSV